MRRRQFRSALVPSLDVSPDGTRHLIEGSGELAHLVFRAYGDAAGVVACFGQPGCRRKLDRRLDDSPLEKHGAKQQEHQGEAHQDPSAECKGFRTGSQRIDLSCRSGLDHLDEFLNRRHDLGLGPVIGGAVQEFARECRVPFAWDAITTLCV